MAADLRARNLVEPAQIVEASIEIARDADLRDAVEREIAAGASASQAMLRAADHFAGVLAALDDPLLAARATDVRAVGRRLAAASSSMANGTGFDRGSGPGGRSILAGRELTADDLLTQTGAVMGAVSVIGGATAHVGI